MPINDQIAIYALVMLFYMPVERRDVLCDHPCLAGVRRQVLCPEHIFVTSDQNEFKYCMFVPSNDTECDTECSAQEP